jgi:RNA polymerase sigma factor (sigma-70 family)
MAVYAPEGLQLEASALPHSAHAPALIGRSPLLRLQSDEKLIALVRRGHHGAFEALMQRYQPRLLAFCRHMLGSTEDAEDVLQEVFTASFNAICADERPINARPWLYRIARNRCLNHLRRPVPSGQDSMDVFERDGGTSTADTVHKREEFRQIVSDVQDLPETQRTALLLREIDALSYDQIAEAMDTTVPSVKSLLVRARVALAEAAEARLLTCSEVRLELGQVAEGLAKTTSPVRRHLKGCDRCRLFRKELRSTNRALAAVYPLGPLVILKKLLITKLGVAAGGTAASSGTAAAGGTAAGGIGLAGGAAAAGGVTAGGAVSATLGTVASKTVAGLAAAAIVTAGAVEVRHVSREAERAPAAAQVTPALADPVAPAPVPAQAPAVVADAPLDPELQKPAAEPAEEETAAEEELASAEEELGPLEEPLPVATVPPPATTPPATAEQPPAQNPAVDEQQGTTTLPPEGEEPTAAEPDPVAPAQPPANGPAQQEPEKSPPPSEGTMQPGS